jgi:hypothetical protein
MTSPWPRTGLGPRSGAVLKLEGVGGYFRCL